MVQQPRSGERDPLWPGPGDVAARLDRLEQRLADLEGLRPAVESALVAQASRIETVLAAARRDLAEVAQAPVDRATAAADEVREEVARTRDLTADRLARAGAEVSALADEVHATLLRASADADVRLEEVRAAVTATMGPAETLAGAVEALHARVVEVAEDLAAHHDAQAARVEDRLAQGTVDALTEVRSAGTRIVEQLVERLDAHAAGLGKAIASVTALQASLEERLDAMDRAAARERAHLTAAFADQLAEGLSRRERRRLAKRLEVPDLPAETEVPAAPAPAPPAPAPPDPTARPGPPPPEVATPDREIRAVPDEVPSWESLGASSAPEGRPVRVQRVRRIRPSASDARDPAAVRRALAEVRGLGPARQSALMDRFGTLAAIREATDEELLDVRGIGPALLDGIREAAGGDGV